MEDDSIDLALFDVVDFLAGEERTTFMPKNDSVGLYQVFSQTMMQKLSGYLGSGGNIFISGAHIATRCSFEWAGFPGGISVQI